MWTDTSVRFAHQGRGASIGMTDAGPIFELYRDVTPPGEQPDRLRDLLGPGFEPTERKVERTRFSVSFLGGNRVEPIGLDRSASTFNYYVGDASLHRADVAGYEKVVYPGLYDGIDLHAWGQRDSLKYEFHVAPGVDYSRIALRYDGIDHLWIDRWGRLNGELADGFGRVRDDAPVIYQEVSGRRVDIPGRFRLLDEHTYAFDVTGACDPSLPLVIDPDLEWSSYLGGTSDDFARAVEIDTDGNAWITGYTDSAGWAVGGLDTTFNGETDAFVAKVNANGTLAWSTYLGGASRDLGSGIALDGAGAAFVTGTTHIGSYPWGLGGLETTHNGMNDAFVAKLNANGTLAWIAYVGGALGEHGFGVAVDWRGNAFVTGSTGSVGWTVGGFDTNYGGEGDGFIAKVDGDGTIAWSSYLGRFSKDEARAVAVDSAGNAWVTGFTRSYGWLGLGWDSTLDGFSDGFVIKISDNGALLWSSYIGGTGHEIGKAIAVDERGNAFVTGITTSVGWTVGGFDTTLDGGWDAFLAKVNADGTFGWSSYLGGDSGEEGWGIALDERGGAWVTGYTESSGWTVGGFDTSYNGGARDGFIVHVNADGTFGWSSYVGGAGEDDPADIAVDAEGNAWLVGTTSLGGWAVGGFDTSFNGGSTDGFLSKISEQLTVQPAPPAEILARGVGYADWTVGQRVVFGGKWLGYTVDAVFNDPATGFYAVGLTSKLFGPALVFRGTEFSTLGDVYSDLDPRGVGYNQFEANWPAVRGWLNSILPVRGPVDLIGHSLGGALAQWFASEWTRLDNPPQPPAKLVDNVVTFNATGISYAAAGAFDASESNSVAHYIVNGDLVSMAGWAFLPGLVHRANFRDWNLLNKHTLPLLVLAMPQPNGSLRLRPSDVAFDSPPLTIAELNSPLYVHSDPDYLAWVTALNVVALGLSITNPINAGVPTITPLLMARATTEANRATIGCLLHTAVNTFNMAYAAVDRTIIFFQNLGNALYDALQLTVDRGINLLVSGGTLDISGGIGLDFAASPFSIDLPSWLGGPIHVNSFVRLVDVDLNASINASRLQASGMLSLLGGLASVNGSARLEWARGDLAVTGALNLMNGFITADATLRLAGALALAAGGNASVNVPSGVPVIGGTTLAGGSFRLQFTANTTLSDDYVAGWGTLFGKQVGLRVYFNGNWEVLGASQIAAIPPLVGPETTAGGSFLIAPDTDWSLLCAQWTTNSASTAIRLINPLGQVFNEADILSDPTMEIASDLTTPRRRAALINNPMPGVWRIELVNTTGLGTTSFAALGSVGPQPIGTSLTASGGQLRSPVNITLNVANATPTTRVSLFYDNDNSGNDGVLIADDLPVTGGVVNHVWNPATAPLGPLHVYAVVSDANQIPATIYSAAAVTITEVRPEVRSATFDPNLGNAVQVNFSQNVAASLGVDDFVLRNLTTGVVIPTGDLSVAYNPYTQAATLTVAPGPGLPDGNYRLRVLAPGVFNTGGDAMAADYDFDFFALAGDANRDRGVNIADFAILASRFNRPGKFSQGDFNYNGTVEIGDFSILAGKFGTTLPAPRPAGGLVSLAQASGAALRSAPAWSNRELLSAMLGPDPDRGMDWLAMGSA